MTTPTLRRHACGYAYPALGHRGPCNGDWTANLGAPPFTPDYGDARDLAPITAALAAESPTVEDPALARTIALCATAEGRARVRGWAKQRGLKVGDRGAIGRPIQAEYAHAHAAELR
jgi:hypothetical protein